MNFKNVNENFVIVEPIVTVAEEKTQSCLYLPPTHKVSPRNKGRVIAAGPGIWSNGIFVENSIKVGDTVMFHPGAFHEIELNDKQYGILKSYDIFTTLENEV